MTFDKMLPLLKSGVIVSRASWSSGIDVAFQPGYPEGINCNEQTANTWGIETGTTFRCNPYFQIRNANGTYSMYTPSVDDILADDWYNPDFDRR